VIACESAPPCVTERKYTDRYILDDDLDCATSFMNCFFSKESSIMFLISIVWAKFADEWKSEPTVRVHLTRNT